MTMDIWIGTYTDSTAAFQGQGAGIYAVRFDPATGAFGPPDLRARCRNPSWIHTSPDRRHLFAVQESFAKGDAALLAFARSETGQLEPSAQTPIPGDAPCHLAFDPIHNRLASAQYGTGDVTLCQFTGDGLAVTAQIDSPGPDYGHGFAPGPDAERQEGPHAHFVHFTDGGSVLHVVDLGADRIFSHRLDPAGRVVDSAACAAPAGSGPRHLAIAGDAQRAFALGELDETLLGLSRDGLGWRHETTQPAFADGPTQSGAAAAIRFSPDERFLYVSGRRQNRITAFDRAGVPLGTGPSGGDFPRDFIITSDGRWCIVANQMSNAITSIARDPDTGMLGPMAHECAIGSPVSVLEV